MQLADAISAVSNYRKRVQELLDVIRDTFDSKTDDPALLAKMTSMCTMDEKLPWQFDELRPLMVRALSSCQPSDMLHTRDCQQVFRASMHATEAHETFLKYRPLVQLACKSDLAKPKVL